MAPFTNIAVNRNNIMETGSTAGPVFMGNLVRNGRFEDGLSHWRSRNVRVVSKKESHEGRGAAGLGACKQNHKSAWLLQCIPLPRTSDPLYFQLFFSVAGFQDAPASLDVTLSWFDTNFELIDHGVEAHIRRQAIGDGSKGKWSTYTFVSDRAPQEADFAVLRFCKQPGKKKANYLIVDDVVLVPIIASSFDDAEDPCADMADVIEEILPDCNFDGPCCE